MLTANQTQRIWEITRRWNDIRKGCPGREEATPSEVVEFLITQEEIGIAAMVADDAAENQTTTVTITAVTTALQQEGLAS